MIEKILWIITKYGPLPAEQFPEVPGLRARSDEAPTIAPGVRGHAIEVGKITYYPIVYAEVPGSGAVSAWLDSIPPHKDVRFPCLVSDLFCGMLRRRGWRMKYEYSEYMDEEVEVYRRKVKRPNMIYGTDRSR